MKKLLILCSGGNAPGMNECVQEFFKLCKLHNFESYYTKHGLKDIYNNEIRKLDNIKFVGCRRFEKFINNKVQDKIIQNINNFKIDIVVMIGGDGSYEAALKLVKKGINVFFIPATIDNDIKWSDCCLGFDSAVNEAVRCCKILNNSYIAHEGINFVEVMGRDCSDLAITVGKKVKADCIILKENKVPKEKLVKIANEAFDNKEKVVRFIVQENTYDKAGSENLRLIKEYVKKKTRRYCELDILGHLQRGAKISKKDKSLVDKFIKSIFRMIKQEAFNYKVGIVKNKVKLMKIKN